MKAGVAKFEELSAQLIHDFPKIGAEIDALTNGIVDVTTAGPDELWQSLWAKPLYANTRVDTAEVWIPKFKQLESINVAWKFWGVSEQSFLIEKKGRGCGNDIFKLNGESARKTSEKTGVARYRLYAMQGCATAIRDGYKSHPQPLAGLAQLNLRDAVSKLRNEFGYGWGPITALHALTDFGLAVKPDLHLVKTMSKLQLTKVSNGKKVPTFNEALAINCDVGCLLNETGGEKSGAGLRRLDKILMEISRQGLI